MREYEGRILAISNEEQVRERERERERVIAET